MKDDKFIKAILKLNKLTKEKKITWGKMTPPRNLHEGTDYVIPYFFGVTYKDKNLGIYEIRYKAIDPETETIYWTDHVILSVFSEDWTWVWDFPDSPAINDLSRTINYQIANVDGLIDSLLDDEEEDDDDI